MSAQLLKAGQEVFLLEDHWLSIGDSGKCGQGAVLIPKGTPGSVEFDENYMSTRHDSDPPERKPSVWVRFYTGGIVFRALVLLKKLTEPVVVGG